MDTKKGRGIETKWEAEIDSYTLLILHRGMVQGGRREEGGGFRMGNTCIPVVDSC